MAEKRTLRFYDAVERIGAGSFGVVYKATTQSGKVVAVKEIKNIFKDRKTLATEFEAYKRLGKHPNVVLCYDYIIPVEQEGPPALLMEYCDEGTLSQFILDRQHLTTVQILKFLEQIANGVYFLHRQRILHRDMKTENIFVKRSSNGEIVCKIADFGIAKVLNMDFVMGTIYSKQILGTYYFMPPEVWHKTYSSKSDIFSFGAIALACLTRCFISRNPQILAPYVNTSTGPNECKQSIGKAYEFGFDVESAIRRQMGGLWDDIQNAIVRMLSPDRKDRPTADECYVEMRAFHLAMSMFKKAMDRTIQSVMHPHSSAVSLDNHASVEEEERLERQPYANPNGQHQSHGRRESVDRARTGDGDEHYTHSRNQRRVSSASNGSRQSFDGSYPSYYNMSSDFDDMSIDRAGPGGYVGQYDVDEDAYVFSGSSQRSTSELKKGRKSSKGSGNL